MKNENTLFSMPKSAPKAPNSVEDVHKARIDELDAKTLEHILKEIASPTNNLAMKAPWLKVLVALIELKLDKTAPAKTDNLEIAMQRPNTLFSIPKPAAEPPSSAMDAHIKRSEKLEAETLERILKEIASPTNNLAMKVQWLKVLVDLIELKLDKTAHVKADNDVVEENQKPSMSHKS